MRSPCRQAAPAVTVRTMRYCVLSTVPDGESDLAARLPHHLAKDWCDVSKGNPLCALGCGRKAASNGRALLCSSHRRIEKKYGDPLAVPIRPMIPRTGTCSYGDCENPVRCGGLCGTHYQRKAEGRSLDSMYMRNKGNPCSADDCEAPAVRKGLCEACYRRKVRAENGDQVRARTQAWRDRTRDERRAVFRAWEKANPEKVSLRDRRSKARRRATTGVPDPLNYELILAEHGMTCHICESDIESFDDLHFDHVIPLARGGAHSYENVRPSHKRCNLRKGTRLMSELLAAGGR